MANEFDSLLSEGYAEAFDMLAVDISIDGTSIRRGQWQTSERGKSLASQAGFEQDIGGQLILRKSDVPDPSILSGKKATRKKDGLVRRISGVNETRISIICELMPEVR
jgi:hypothetical protein